MDDSDSEREAPKRASLVGMLPLMAVAACCILLLLLHSHNHRFDKAHHVGPKAMNRTASICRGHRYFCSDLISLSNLEISRIYNCLCLPVIAALFGLTEALHGSLKLETQRFRALYPYSLHMSILPTNATIVLHQASWSTSKST